MTAAIKLRLIQPDSGANRERIKTFCELIKYHSFDVMNVANYEAENFHAHHVDKVDRDLSTKIHDAARAAPLNH